MSRLSEIDAIKRNLAGVLTAIEKAGSRVPASTDFHERLDALIEARNVSLAQIATVGDLIEAAFLAGRAAR